MCSSVVCSRAKNVTIECCCPNTWHFSRLNKDQQSTKYLNDEIEDPAPHKEHTKQQLKMHVAHAQNYEVACNAIINHCFTSYAFWHCFFQVNNLLVWCAWLKYVSCLIIYQFYGFSFYKKKNCPLLFLKLCFMVLVYGSCLLMTWQLCIEEQISCFLNNRD